MNNSKSSPERVVGVVGLALVVITFGCIGVGAFWPNISFSLGSEDTAFVNRFSGSDSNSQLLEAGVYGLRISIGRGDYYSNYITAIRTADSKGFTLKAGQSGPCVWLE